MAYNITGVFTTPGADPSLKQNSKLIYGFAHTHSHPARSFILIIYTYGITIRFFEAIIFIASFWIRIILKAG